MSTNVESQLTLTGDRYDLGDLRKLLSQRPKLALHPEVRTTIDAGHQLVLELLSSNDYIYGVNTGFGSLCETPVKGDEVERLQYNHVVSHACGVGPFVPEDQARLTLFIKLLTLRSGRTGISSATVDRLIEFWNASVIPAIPQKGTVGASGDLAPLAHMSLPLLGLGYVHWEGGLRPAKDALQAHGWEPLRLGPKEGLALTNGVQYINALTVAALLEVEELVTCADLLAALSAQAFSCASTFYHPLYHSTSHHAERRVVAANLGKALSGSNHDRISTCNRSRQDPYSFRCVPQVHGAARQAFAFGLRVLEDEVNGVSDNPLFFAEEGMVLFGGNLHGESTAMAADLLAIAVSELASISERRTYQLLSGQRGLPSFLVRRPGVNSGLMVAQYTSAALVSENKVLCHPASVDSIPTCQLQEDHVSMGGMAAYKLHQVIENAWSVFSIELLTAAQATEMNRELESSPFLREVVGCLRQRVSHLEVDRVIADDIAASLDVLRTNRRRWTAALEEAS